MTSNTRAKWRARYQPNFMSVRDIFESTRLSRLRKVLASEIATVWLVTLVVHCCGLEIYRWVVAGLLCNLSLLYIAWILMDGLYDTHWTSLLFRSRRTMFGYLALTAEIHGFKAFWRLLLRSLGNSGYVLNSHGLIDVLIASAWIVVNIIDNVKMAGLLPLCLLLGLGKVIALFVMRPLFISWNWLGAAMSYIFRQKKGRSNSQYQYSALAADEIRLLRLPRRLLYCPLHLEAITVKLKDAPVYEAISYTWGTAKQTRDIRLNGRIFETSVAAYEVLEGRSSVFRSRYIWIDYICINQDDLSEKAAQVEKMIEIYRQARRVVVWLGGLTFDRKTMHTTDQIHMMSLRLMEGMSALEVYEGIVLHQDTDEWLCFIQLWTHKWFTRLWVVQEAAVAKKVYFCYAGHLYPWECFGRIADIFKDPNVSVLLNRTPAARQAHRNMIMIGLLEQLRPTLRHNSVVETIKEVRDAAKAIPIDSFRKAVDDWTQRRYDRAFRHVIRGEHLHSNDPTAPIPLSFAHLLTQFAIMDVTDDRDRVFALRGLVTGLASPTTAPDYTKSVETIYTDLSKEMLQSNRPFGTVGYAGIGLPRRLGLPSFVPDWSCTSKTLLPLTAACFRTEDFQLSYKAAGTTEPKVEYIASEDDRSSLHVEGVILDVIRTQTDTLPQQYQQGDDELREGRAEEYKSQLAWVNNARNITNDAHIYGGDDARVEALWRTLIVDRKGAEHPAPPEMYDDYESWLEFAHKVPDMTSLSSEEDRELTTEERSILKAALASTWSSHMAGGCCGRCFCLTEEGRMGLVLPGTQVGDSIFIAYGAATPWVIRPVHKDNEPGHDYQLVGECYIHGIMKGEAMSLPLQPTEIRLW